MQHFQNFANCCCDCIAFAQSAENIETNVFENYQAGSWAPIRRFEPAAIVMQSLGNGNTGINIVGNKIRKLVFPGDISVDEDLYSPEIKTDSKSDMIIV